VRRTAIFLALFACSSEPIAPPVDAGTSIDSGEEPTCEVSIDADRVSITEGSKVLVSTNAADAEVSLRGPSGWTQRDLSFEAPYGERGTFEVTATATCSNGAIGTASLSIEVRPLTFRSLPAWTPGADGPSEREHPAMIMDGGDPDRVLLYGGFAFEPQQYTVVDDLWAYDFETEAWTALPTPNAPSFAAGRLAPIEGERALLYYGGSDQNNDQPFVLSRLDFGDSDGEWASISPQGAPDGGSSLGSFVYDPPRDRYLSICGFGYLGIHCDIEAYLAGEDRWTWLTPETEIPEGRYGFFAANDLENERVVIWSGGRFSFDGSVNPAQDTWALELAEEPVRWVKLSDDGPPGRRNGCSAVDPIGHRFFVWGGTPDAATTSPGLWVLDLDRGEEQWIEVHPEGTAPERSSCTAVYDPARHRILFGFGNTTAAIYADWQVLEL
jgi:hypothetical protein